jgi:glyoxylase-like metal-dependent hydrolase (beta-lactamase superfamily II)
MGHLDKAMAEAGIDPSSITIIAFTHAHEDHVCGLLRSDGGDAFPSLSKIVIAEDAVANFLEKPELTPFRRLLAPIRSAERLAEHVHAVPISGHAPGHTGYVLDTGEDKILFCGDLVHVPAAQFARPELSWAYDDDQSIATASRIRLLADAARMQTWLAGAHLGRPGIGRVIAAGRGYAFVPVE